MRALRRLSWPVVLAVVTTAGCGRIDFGPLGPGDTPPADADADASLDPDLLVWLPFDGDPEAGTPDRIGTLDDGVCDPSRCPAPTDGVVGGAYEFDGADDFVQFVTAAALDFGRTGQPFSIAMWYRAVDLTPPVQQVLMAQSTEGGSVSYQLSFEAAKGDAPMDLIWKVCQTDCQSGQFAVAVDLTDLDRWVLVVGTWDGADTRLFIDAGLVATVPKATITFDGSPFMIGADFESGGSIEDTFHGAIDELQIYRRALTVTEQKALLDAAP